MIYDCAVFNILDGLEYTEDVKEEQVLEMEGQQLCEQKQSSSPICPKARRIW